MLNTDSGFGYPIIYTVDDIQKMFKCGKRQAYELVNSKDFPSLKIGKKIYIYRNSLVEWLLKNSNKDTTIVI